MKLNLRYYLTATKMIRTFQLGTLIYFLSSIVPLNAQPCLWAKSIGGQNDDLSESITVDSKGNNYITGYFRDTVDFDPGPGIYNLTSVGHTDIFISKLNANGDFVWAKSIGGIDFDWGNSIAVDAIGNVYTTGFFTDTVDFDPGSGIYNLTSYQFRSRYSATFISKLDTNGNFVWAKSIGGYGRENSDCITVDSKGNNYITGYFIHELDFDPGVGKYYLTSAGYNDGLNDIFILKLDTNGNFVWAKRMGGVDGDWGISIAVDANENVYTTGLFEGSANFDPGTGTYNLTSAGAFDIFISKLDANGNFLWAKKMGGVNDDYGLSIAVDSDGDVYTTGCFRDTVDFDPGTGTYNLTSSGERDFFISKLDSNANFLWAKKIGGLNDDYSSSVAVDLDGNVYNTGSFQDTVDFDPNLGTYNLTSNGKYDIFISKLDENGDFVWAKSIGGAIEDYGYSNALDSDGNVYITGDFSNTVNFIPPVLNNLISKGGRDIFVAKYSDVKVGTQETISGNNIKIYPNPTNGNFNIDLGEQLSIVEVIITDALGQEINKKHYGDVSKLNLYIKGDPGVYFLFIKSGNKTITLKALKQ
ncbi:MAG: SBBP repeat-containing protein [Bacteroidota bacterium]|nr:SBBP repeat-containing protein [Bacteroidota bacterium]